MSGLLLKLMILSFGFMYGACFYSKNNDSCGINYAGHIMQEMADPEGFIRGLFWRPSKEEVMWVEVKSAKFYCWKDGDIYTQQVPELAEQELVRIIPVYDYSSQYIIVTNHEVRRVADNEDGSYNLSKPLYSSEDGRQIRHARTDGKRRLILGLMKTGAKDDRKDVLIINKQHNQFEKLHEDDMIGDFILDKESDMLYYITDYGDAVYAVKYNLESGEVGEGKKLVYEIRFTNNEMLHSIAIDENDNLILGADSKIIHYFQEKDFSQQVEIPIGHVVSITTAGQKLDHLWFISNKDNMTTSRGTVYALSFFYEFKGIKEHRVTFN